MTKQLKPFGIEHLTQVNDGAAQKVNGGLGASAGTPPLKSTTPPIVHTNYISRPATVFPAGDHG